MTKLEEIERDIEEAQNACEAWVRPQFRAEQKMSVRITDLEALVEYVRTAEKCLKGPFEHGYYADELQATRKALGLEP